MALDLDTRLVCVEGLVQGVGFREACVQRARSLRLAGWVRNRLDGSVEVMLQGPSEAVARMLDWLREGPPGARVERVTPGAIAPSMAQLMDRFERRATA
jgi:acylphosphatase